MVVTEEIQIGTIGSTGTTTSVPDSDLKIGTLTLMKRETEVTPEESDLYVGTTAILPEQTPFIGISERAPVPVERSVITGDHLVAVYQALGTCRSLAELYSVADEYTINSCIRVLISMGLIAKDGSGLVCNNKAVQDLVDQVKDLCIG